MKVFDQLAVAVSVNRLAKQAARKKATVKGNDLNRGSPFNNKPRLPGALPTQ